MNAQIAFELAIKNCYLSADENSGENFAGNWMFMGPSTTPGHVTFKNSITRESFKMPL